MKRWIIAIVVLIAAGGGVGAWYANRNKTEIQVNTAPLSRGDIVDTVGATGALQAVTTVQVGSQVSGNIQWRGADFNSIVTKGQVIARRDASLIDAQLQQERARLTQAEANVNQMEVNRNHTVIEAPIDGIVTQRNVDVGQTVAASMQAPTLFIIAADLREMQVNANIDEADVGRIRPGQHVTFRVDAYPTDSFNGTVTQVRLQPVVVQNVTTYGTVITVPNTDLKLKPGMTANVKVEIAKKTDVLLVPNSALRFRPTIDLFAALNQAVPPELTA